MALEHRVAAEDGYALDQWGIRRLIHKGDVLPEGWRLEDEPREPKKPAPEPKDKRKVDKEAA